MKKLKVTWWCLWLVSIYSGPCGFAEFSWEDYYDIVSIPAPAGTDNQIGGLDLDREGKIVACFHRGEVLIYDEEHGEWELFATGLHEPLGVYVEDEGTILVIQRSELTRLHDKNGDGLADFYEVVCNDWGMTGNYHEFAFGIVKDSQKNIYITLGTASNGAGIREEIRGEWNDAGGLTREDFLQSEDREEWNEKKKQIARMYSRVPYRGCVLKIKPDSLKAQVYATGLRTPNGLYVDSDDQLWVSDNQGDWVGASKLHRIEEGRFYGHAASLLWGEDPPNIEPTALPISELEARREKAVGLFPQGDCANSLTQILPYRPEFGPLLEKDGIDKQLIIGEMNHSRIVRYLPDFVNGREQGTGTHILDTISVGMGNNRLMYSPDGRSLYLGKTHLSWPGREGMKKVTYKGIPYLQVESVELTPEGFRFLFNAPIEAPIEESEYHVEAYRIAYHAQYGSKKFDLEQFDCSRIEIEGNVLTLKLKQKPVPNRVYDITLPQSVTSDISELSYNRFWYTAHEVY